MTDQLPDGWSDCSALMDGWAGAVYPGEDIGSPRIAWIDEDGVSGLDEEDNEIEPPAEVRQWLEAQAAKRGGAEDPERDRWLAECAKGCRCCSSCWECPCSSCAAGGVCDAMPCRCDDEDDEEVPF